MEIKDYFNDLTKKQIIEADNEGRPVRVAIYARTHQGADNTLLSQIRLSKDLIGQHSNWVFDESTHLFIDEDGSSMREDRVGFQQMKKAVLGNEFDLLLTADISRFSRNAAITFHTIKKFQKFGVGVYFIKDNFFTFDESDMYKMNILARL